MSIDSNQKDPSKKMGMWMVVLAWVLFIGLMTIYFTRWSDKQYNPNQTLSKIITDEGVKEVVLKRNRYGHYVVTGTINAHPVDFMIDTGASDISVPEKIAAELGLRSGAPIVYQTANGQAVSYSTMLESVSIGSIVLKNVRASINPNVSDTDILLGMTFLKQLEFSQRGDQLTIRQYP